MLDARKSAILRKVVSKHIETGEPVGSNHVVREAAIDVSPATVRADMASLERDGYLTHPHTSAGRVPTDLGYRFFVDHLEATSGLDPSSEEQVAEFFARAHGELDNMLRDTSRLLSRLTDHAAVVVGPPHDTLVVRSALLTRIAPKVLLLVVVLSNGVVDKHVVDVDDTTSDAAVEAANVAVREHLSGQTFSTLSWPSASSGPEVDAIVTRCLRTLGDAASPSPESNEVYVGGTSRMADQFPAVETVREVLSILEQSLVVVSLLSEVLSKGLSVSIGAENHVESLSECSLVVAPYEVGGQVIGTIGVLGPTRMNYPQALAAVAVVSQHLGQQLAGG